HSIFFIFCWGKKKAPRGTPGTRRCKTYDTAVCRDNNTTGTACASSKFRTVPVTPEAQEKPGSSAELFYPFVLFFPRYGPATVRYRETPLPHLNDRPVAPRDGSRRRSKGPLRCLCGRSARQSGCNHRVIRLNRVAAEWRCA